MSETLVYENQTFTNLSSMEAKPASYENCIFSHCQFLQQDLRQNNFSDVKFESCRINLCSMTNCQLRGVTFIECQLVGLDFCQIDQLIVGIDFGRCHLDSCNFSGLDLPKISFRDCKLANCDFVSTRLLGADFRQVEFSNTVFHQADLRQADFRHALNYQLNPLTNQIKKAKFSTPEVINLLADLQIEIS